MEDDNENRFKMKKRYEITWASFVFYNRAVKYDYDVNHTVRTKPTDDYYISEFVLKQINKTEYKYIKNIFGNFFTMASLVVL
jgi:hypothetical protein